MSRVSRSAQYHGIFFTKASHRAGSVTCDVDAKNSPSFSTPIFLVVLVFLLAAGFAPPVTAQANNCSNSSTGLTPLTDLGTDTYQGEEGGLYPDGSNEIPEQHLELGLELAAQVVPRAGDGTPDHNGVIGFTSIGVSNTVEMFKAFTEDALALGTNPDLVLVNGAQRGRAMEQWANRTNHVTWNTLEETVARGGLTAEQIQVAWIYLPGRTRGPRTLAQARDEMEQLTRVLQFAKDRYPNLVLAYMSSREYGGYIPDSDSEPNAYHHGFQVKWLIEEQINGSLALNPDPESGTVESPWLAWGPYLWADGTTSRSDGLFYACDDFTAGGVHPGPEAEEKIATLMMEHFLTDPTAAGWFPGTLGGSLPSTTTAPASTVPPTTGTSASVTSSLPASETTVALAPSTSSDLGAQEDSDSQESSEMWPSALTGLGVGFALGAFAGLTVRRSRTDSS